MLDLIKTFMKNILSLALIVCGVVGVGYSVVIINNLDIAFIFVVIMLLGFAVQDIW